jgi:hypothetical protein
VIGKLRRSLRASGYGCSQMVHPCSGGSGRGIQLRNFILLEAFCWMPARYAELTVLAVSDSITYAATKHGYRF